MERTGLIEQVPLMPWMSGCFLRHDASQVHTLHDRPTEVAKHHLAQRRSTSELNVAASPFGLDGQVDEDEPTDAMIPEKAALCRSPKALLKSVEAPLGGMTPLNNHLNNAWREVAATSFAGEVHLLCN